MRSLAYHEAVPATIFRSPCNLRCRGSPGFAATASYGGLSAHTEGWALYAERLAAENNWYDGDRIGALGQLESELFRARRLVVDTGLHAKKWTRSRPSTTDQGCGSGTLRRQPWPGVLL
jgi:uncharacterized protein (DUF885 family)